MHPLFLTVMLLWVCTKSKEHHYSTFSFLYTILVRALRQYDLYPLMICNNIGLCATWYYAILFLDRTIPTRMMQKYDCSLWLYLLGEFVIHLIPVGLAFHTLWNFEEIRHYLNSSAEIVQLCGFYSMMVNHMWPMCIQDGYQLNQAYVNLSAQSWCYIWTVNVVSHILSMHWFRYMLQVDT